MMNQNTTIGAVAIAAAIVISAGIASYTATVFGKNTAVDSCANVALSITDGEFVQSVYQLCLKDKGYGS